MSHQPEFSMVKVDGRTLRVAFWKASRTTAEPKMPLLFFNGIGANIEAMAPLPEALDDRDFVTFDMPGVGESPDPVVPYNPILMARVAAQILDRYELPIVDVMGVSWGGAMAQQFALQYGDRVHKLILAATTAGMIMMPGNPKALVKMADPRRYMDPDFMRKHFNTLYGGSGEGSEGHIGRIKAPSKTGYFYQLLAMLGWTSAPFLPFMKKETLIIIGDDDQIVVPVNGEFLRMLIPNSKLVTIKGGGHLFMLSHRDETIAALRDFLDAPEAVQQAA